MTQDELDVLIKATAEVRTTRLALCAALAQLEAAIDRLHVTEGEKPEPEMGESNA